MTDHTILARVLSIAFDVSRSYEISLPFRRRGQDEPVWHDVSILTEMTQPSEGRLTALFAELEEQAFAEQIQLTFSGSVIGEQMNALRRNLNVIARQLPKQAALEQLGVLDFLAREPEELPLEPTEVRDAGEGGHLTSMGVRSGAMGYVTVQNRAALDRWTEHANDLLDKMERASTAREARAADRREKEIHSWIADHGSDELKAALASCAGPKLGPVRGQYVRERVEIEMYGWTPVPFSALHQTPRGYSTEGFEHLIARGASFDSDQARSALGDFPLAERGPENADDLVVTTTVVSGHEVKEFLKASGFRCPRTLAIDLLDDVALVTGLYRGYVLVRSFELRTTKARMWETLAEGVARRGIDALDYLSPCLEDTRWQVWLSSLPDVDRVAEGKRLDVWICESQSSVLTDNPVPAGLWTARERALVEMLDLNDADHGAMRKMIQLASPLAA